MFFYLGAKLFISHNTIYLYILSSKEAAKEMNMSESTNKFAYLPITMPVTVAKLTAVSKLLEQTTTAVPTVQSANE